MLITTPALAYIRKLFLCCALLLMSVPLFAAPIIDVNGNKKTRTPYIEKLTQICLSTTKVSGVADITPRELSSRLRQCLINSGLFSQVLISYTEERITVTVTEKISFLVLPTYQRSQVIEDTLWGILFFEANVAGRGHSSGLLYTHRQEQKRDSYSFFYDIPHIDKAGKHGFTIIGYDRDTDFISYDNMRWNYKTREIFQFLWLRGTYYIKPSFKLLYGYAPSTLSFSESINRDDPTAVAPDSYYETQSINLGISWDSINRQYYYDKGFRFETTHYQQLSRTDGKELSGVSIMEMYYGSPPTPDSRHIFSLI